MGSNQSVPPSSPGTEASTFPTGEQSPLSKKDSDSTQKKKRPPPKNLTGAALVEYKCRRKKKAWSQCVGSWYEGRFLPGTALEDEEADCDELFETYRHCYMRGILKDREKKGLAAPKENTMLAEYIEEERIQPEKEQS